MQWKKSSYSSAYNGCVEVAAAPGAVLVRDSKDQAGPVLEFTPQQWREFLRRVGPSASA